LAAKEILFQQDARAKLLRGVDGIARAVRVTLADAHVPAEAVDTDLLDLDEALTRLAAIDERKAELIQLNYFGGLTFREMEALTGLSSSTLDRELRLARAWMKAELSRE